MPSRRRHFFFLDVNYLIQDKNNIPIIYHAKRHKKNKKILYHSKENSLLDNLDLRYSMALSIRDKKDTIRTNKKKYWWLD